jgi:hypothetical protein
LVLPATDPRYVRTNKTSASRNYSGGQKQHLMNSTDTWAIVQVLPENRRDAGLDPEPPVYRVGAVARFSGRQPVTLSPELAAAIVSKLRAAEAELHLVIIDEEKVSEASSDLRGVIERLQGIILKIQSPPL